MTQTAGNFSFKITFSCLSLLFFQQEMGNAKQIADQVPGLSVAQFALPTITPMTETITPTGTPVGCQVADIKKDLQGLESQTGATIQATRELYEKAILEVSQYHKVVGIIEAKLQLGTTPGNPQLTDLRNKAIQQLSQIIATIEVMKGLSQNIAQSSQQVKTLFARVNEVLRLPGAVDEDHAHLFLISDELGYLDENVQRTLGIIETNIGRQSEWLSMERLHIDSLSSGIEMGRIAIVCESGPQSHSLPVNKAKSHSHPKKHAKASRSKPQEISAHIQKVTEPVQAAPNSLPKAVEGQLEKPLPKVSVTSHPSIPTSAPAPASNPTPAVEPAMVSREFTFLENLNDFESAAKGRTPLAVLEATQSPEEHQWYLSSSAQRGMTNSTDMIDIISVIDKTVPSKKGEEVKKILIARGYKPEQLQVITATGSADQIGKVYLFH
jgi:hypothetical protein